jgi:hypothetical protein
MCQRVLASSVAAGDIGNRPSRRFATYGKTCHLSGARPAPSERKGDKMASSSASKTTVFPYQVQRILSKYAPAIRVEVERHLDEKAVERGGPNSLRLEDLGWAFSCALAGIADAKAATPQPDPRMVKLSLAACRAGNFVTAEEFINARKRRSDR